MDTNIQITASGIQCDHCDYTDKTVPLEDMEKWLNKPCPECGENLLTEEDFLALKELMNLVDLFNTVECEKGDLYKGRIEFDGSGNPKLSGVEKVDE